MQTMRRIMWGVVVASAALTGCVGYDGSSDGASMQAQSLGLTQAEESRIREALNQKALSAEEIARVEASLEERALPTEWGTQSFQAIGVRRRDVPDGELCLGDINCRSGHCSPTNACVASFQLKKVGTEVQFGWECESHRAQATKETLCTKLESMRCTKTEEVLVTRCVSARAADSNKLKDQDETDVDCGGLESPFSCPLDNACTKDDDCLTGACVTFPSGVSKCQSQRSSTVDLGHTWPAKLDASQRMVPGRDRQSTVPTERFYQELINVPEKTIASEQVSAVNSAPQLYSGTSKVAAAITRAYQHDTCVAHLIAQGCSPIALQTRSHRVTYDLILCPQSARDTGSRTGVTSMV